MSKLHISLLAVLLIALAGLTVLAVSKYEHESKGLTLVQAVAQRDEARKGIVVEETINKQLETANSTFNGDVNNLTSQKATLCAQIVKAHLVQPICQ